MDKRSDIWAFGAVLYEMVTGARAFDGDDVSYTLANVLKSDPDWSRLPAGTPFAVRRVLQRCLEKDPRRRYHDIADVRLDLEEPPPVPTPAQHALPARASWRERIAWMLVVGLLGAGLAYSLSRPQPPPQTVQFSVDPPDGTTFGTPGGICAAAPATSGTISPDGTRLLFALTDRKTGSSVIWLRPLDSFKAQPLPGTEGGSQPFWHPHGRSIAFFAGGKLKKLDLSGGCPRRCACPRRAPGRHRASSGVIVYAAGNPGGLFSPRRGRRPLRSWRLRPDLVRPGRRGAVSPGRPAGSLWRQSAEGRAAYVGSIDPGFMPRRLMESKRRPDSRARLPLFLPGRHVDAPRVRSRPARAVGRGDPGRRAGLEQPRVRPGGLFDVGQWHVDVPLGEVWRISSAGSIGTTGCSKPLAHRAHRMPALSPDEHSLIYRRQPEGHLDPRPDP